MTTYISNKLNTKKVTLSPSWTPSSPTSNYIFIFTIYDVTEIIKTNLLFILYLSLNIELCWHKHSYLKSFTQWHRLTQWIYTLAAYYKKKTMCIQHIPLPTGYDTRCLKTGPSMTSKICVSLGTCYIFSYNVLSHVPIRYFIID